MGLFFPDRNVSGARAKAICRDCPVRYECLEFASVTGQRGIWGGLDEDQRRHSRLCRNLRHQAAG